MSSPAGCAPSEDQEVSLKWRRRALAAAWLVSGAGFGLVAVTIPFIVPALRKYCLPYVPATSVQVEKVLCQLKGRTGKVVDLGSGDGRVVIAAAQQGHYAVGYELNMWLVLYSRCMALFKGVNSRTEFHRRDLWKVDLSAYENIVFFGVESMMKPLGDKIVRDLSRRSDSGRGTRIIACRFRFPNQTPTVSFELGPNSVWVYDSFQTMEKQNTGTTSNEQS